MMAYLVMMSQRLFELRRVLRSTGSLYLHCDPTASHYLKIVLDALFGPRNFRSEIVWKRTSAHSNTKVGYGDVTDTILFYSAGQTPVWNKLFQPLDERHVAAKYTYLEEDGRRYSTRDLRNPSRRPNLHYEYKGYQPHPNGWSISRELMEKYDAENRLYFPKNMDGRIRLKLYLDDQKGQPLQNLWTDIPPLNSQARERLGYPTQKPVALLKRILAASSKENDVVLDPFCGCGTTVAAAQETGRRWIGIDVAYHAIRVIEGRLSSMPGVIDYSLGGIPRDFESAARLAAKDKYQFQWWANYLVGVQTMKEIKRGPDRGIDGQMYFMNGPRGWGRVLTSVKGGQHVGSKDVREFKAVIDRERAEMGLFLCLNEPTRDMATEAAAFGFVQTAHGHLPRLQIVSISEWFRGKRPLLPSLGHISREFFEPEKRAKQKKGKAPDPNAPEFTFTFQGAKSESTVVHFNPVAVKA
ncbi:site-specific DNA-methyltransferase [Agrobacterium fabrum]|uniref:site-specific DNA-methyltransferase n=1 Tax=Agrobacterium fabrum TaxID=1176649 RepID=UPI00000D2353|nr:site-specific DNA-methyltransferase [Agrobacterium fabrum]KJX86381.1 DNA methyltransferase [Agrobacterium tumefaciens]MCX2875910.1 site-specific DNA-methyltransferase [Agrobacterium fabrum]WEN03129.1 site-specific DNA-methyltransferase [Agrobacterium fabrum]WER18866.1 site-specific DNA-methyltransferase [Agrobacterium fabrum]WJK76679.1 DNA methyltransferase [Agrobacterium fabrum]